MGSAYRAAWDSFYTPLHVNDGAERALIGAAAAEASQLGPRFTSLEDTLRTLLLAVGRGDIRGDPTVDFGDDTV
jgi:hypothetical protein